jgi:predicted RNase H-like HicB family nuclease
MRKVVLIYHAEPEGFWAESPDVPGFSAAGDSLGAVVDLARDGAELHLGDDLNFEERLVIEGAPEVTGSWAWASSLRATVDQALEVATRAAGVLTTHVASAPAGRVTLHPGAPIAGRG